MNERPHPLRDVRVLTAGASALVGWKLLQRMGELDLEDRVVLVTGGSRGLGLAMAEEFALHGARVVVCARDRTELDHAAEHLDATGARGFAVRCDVAERGQVARMVRKILRRYGAIDVLVNNASVIHVGPLAAMREEDFREAMEVNFWGTVYPTFEVLPSMRARGTGRIVNVTSIGARVSVPHLLPYNSAKFAAYGFSEGSRAELARDGIRVTTVVPGLMRTGSPAHAWFKGDAEREYAWFSLGDATSLTAMSARRAARRIVRATRRGSPHLALTWQARLLRLVHDLAPGGTARLLGLANRLLPTGEDATRRVRGMEISTTLTPSWLTRQMNRAARELHQYLGDPDPSPEHARDVGLGRRWRNGA